MEESVKNNEQIKELKCQIFDIIREQEPLVVKREQLTNIANSQINDINNVISKLENLKAPKVQQLLELEKIQIVEKKPMML